MKVEKMSF